MIVWTVLALVLAVVCFSLYVWEWCQRTWWQAWVTGTNARRKNVERINRKLYGRLRDLQVSWGILDEQHNQELSEMEDALDITVEAATETIDEAIELGEDLYRTCKTVTEDRDDLILAVENQARQLSAWSSSGPKFRQMEKERDAANAACEALRIDYANKKAQMSRAKAQMLQAMDADGDALAYKSMLKDIGRELGVDEKAKEGLIHLALIRRLDFDAKTITLQRRELNRLRKAAGKVTNGKKVRT